MRGSTGVKKYESGAQKSIEISKRVAMDYTNKEMTQGTCPHHICAARVACSYLKRGWMLRKSCFKKYPAGKFEDQTHNFRLVERNAWTRGEYIINKNWFLQFVTATCPTGYVLEWVRNWWRSQHKNKSNVRWSANFIGSASRIKLILKNQAGMTIQ